MKVSGVIYRAELLRCVCRALERNCVRELREKWRDCYCELIHTDVRYCIICFFLQWIDMDIMWS